MDFNSDCSVLDCHREAVDSSGLCKKHRRIDIQQKVNIEIVQPPLDLDTQQKVYEAVEIVNTAMHLSYEERGGTAAERAAVLRLMEAGWRPPC